jgi:hypothetical protein
MKRKSEKEFDTLTLGNSQCVNCEIQLKHFQPSLIFKTSTFGDSPTILHAIFEYVCQRRTFFCLPGMGVNPGSFSLFSFIFSHFSAENQGAYSQNFLSTFLVVS